MTIERLHTVDDTLNIVCARGAVHLIYIYRVNRVEFENVVVNTHECLVNIGAMDECGVAQHRYFGIGEILVAQTYDILHDGCKLWMGGRFTITRKGKNIRLWTVCLHIP